MEIDSAITARHSCRAFLTSPVSQELITEIVTLAQRSPSWCNSQAWQLDITTGTATSHLSDALIAAASDGTAAAPDVPWPARYVDAYAERRRTCGFALYDSVGIARDDHDARFAQALENLRFFGAPHVAIVTSPKDLGAYGLIDCGSFISTFQYVAQSRGVSTIAQAAPTMYSETIRGELGISPDRDILCALAFGFEDTEHPINRFRTERADASSVIAWHESPR